MEAKNSMDTKKGRMALKEVQLSDKKSTYAYETGNHDRIETI